MLAVVAGRVAMAVVPSNPGVQVSHGGASSDRTLGVARQLRVGQHLFRAGDAVTHIWSVQKGSIKIYGISPAGEEQVIGFFFEGDIVGWEGLACGTFHSNARALEACTVFCVSSAAVIAGALGSPERQAWIFDGIRRDFLRLQKIVRSEHRNADGRLAGLLLWLAESQCHPDDPQMVRLPMSRRDIASYLGMAFETVSRRLALFDRNGWTTTLGRRCIRINDVGNLQRLGGT